jgi:acyl transferase domain-containing protein/NADPH:quinone reductase-like Zn-dependent oxidoreductase/acyl carrier protein/SAM-dependent methyltransferase
LKAGRCAVTKIPRDRWCHSRFGHPRRSEPGKAYTWAAGVLSDIWSFDPGAFGISPREAEQMDPQQRLLLELVWEALEDAGIPPSSLAGEEVGVFVGASAQDYGNSKLFDIASGDQYFATGNTLSLISNRISYIYDLRGPSFTVDTACSSSLVALNEAVAAIRSGRIDTAVVAGVSLLVSPFSFISFSRASMLSPTGLCQAFDAKADGYVRAEGGVVLVLRALPNALGAANLIHGLVVGSGINQDGRTVGIAMPNRAAQAALLARVYHESAIEPERLAFIECHGTGTRVGDPAEAFAIGETLAQKRSRPLPIGSIKTNLGHLEPASGLVGTLKAILALEHDLLPQSLHCVEPNPDIPFDELNLKIASSALPLPRVAGGRYAGINSFGFGGTNAHVVLADAPRRERIRKEEGPAPQFLFLSAHSRAALSELASRYADRLENAQPHDAQIIASAASHRRDMLQNRLAVTSKTAAEIVTALRRFAAKEDTPGLVVGSAVERSAPAAFIYSGNGSQWPGMGRAAYRVNTTFARAFREIDDHFKPLAGWSLKDALFADNLVDRLKLTSIAQPLIFAIQSATTTALRELGLSPAVVLGHSVGEIAAAEAAGCLSLPDAVRVIHSRSLHQELAHNHGGMAVIFAKVEVVEELLATTDELEIAAYNSTGSVTVSGSFAALDQLTEEAARAGVKVHRLDLDYPFHCQSMDVVRKSLIEDLASLSPHAGRCEFVSTVEGKTLSGLQLGADYWWRNVREPVQFVAGVQEAARRGARVFVEIGPRKTLLGHVGDNLESAPGPFALLGVLDRDDTDIDPFRRAAATAFVRGARLDMDVVAGTDPGAGVALPAYPWQRKPFRLEDTSEAMDVLTPRTWHPLIGARLTSDAFEWRAHVDTKVVPELDDHRIEDQALLPGAGIIEMAWAVAREWLGNERAFVTDLEILQPMVFAEDASREVLTRISPTSGVLEILSRPRLSRAGWQLHATAKIVKPTDEEDSEPLREREGGERFSSARTYKLASDSTLNFGPTFRQVDSVMKHGEDFIVVDLVPPRAAQGFVIDPARLDSCFHGLICLFADSDNATPYVPVRVADARLLKQGIPARAAIDIAEFNDRTILAGFRLYDEQGDLIARLSGARFQANPSKTALEYPALALTQRTVPIAPFAGHKAPQFRKDKILEQLRALTGKGNEKARANDTLLLEGWATSFAFQLVKKLAGRKSVIDVERLVQSGRLAQSAKPWLLNIVYALEASGLAEANEGRWTLKADARLPDPRTILQTLAREHADRAAELLLASRLTSMVARLSATDLDLFSSSPFTNTALDNYDLGSSLAARSSDQARACFASVSRERTGKQMLRILVVGYGQLAHRMASHAGHNTAQLTVFEPDPRRFERAKHAFDDPEIELINTTEGLPAASYDVVLSAGALNRVAQTRQTVQEIAHALSPGGLLLAVEPSPSLFRDIVCGLDATWFDVGAGNFPIGPLQDAEGWKRLLKSAGLIGGLAEEIAVSGGESLLVFAEKSPKLAAGAAEPRSLLLLRGKSERARAITASLSKLLLAQGHGVAITDESEIDRYASDAKRDHVIYVALAQGDGDPADALARRCLNAKRVVEKLQGSQADLWIVTSGAWAQGRDRFGAIDSGLWTFMRTFANELNSTNIHMADIAAELDADQASAQLADAVLTRTAETELSIRPHEVKAVRVIRAADVPRERMNGEAVPAKLSRGPYGGLDRMAWTPLERAAPKAGEVEIEIEASGLNFRDLMWAMSLLPEEILEDGFAGPTLGLESAGRVVRVGEGVTQFKPGDHVTGFTPSAFANYATVPSHVLARVPGGMSSEAAATIPVAFCTAYYGLVTLGRLSRGEWVLIHGGAGGVGLAALQIALSRGAKVIATAGSEERRDLLKVLGAHHVLDSRSLAFSDEVHRITDDGADVVLNSLAGDAMERGIRALKPFGRFVELGKRDFIANTHIGLRPFRRNLSYFGVDLDQLLINRRGASVMPLPKVMSLFEQGVFSALPYRAFPAERAVDAFRLMQQSGHVGKIVITPPVPGTVHRTDDAERKFVVDPARAHMITGGFGGFGLETAKWFARKGAKHLVLVGRRGPADDDAHAALAELKAQGVKVYAEACDIADAQAADDLFKRLKRTAPPIAGIIHGAMVLDDSIIANLDAEKLLKVLRPKVLGAENLDRLSRGLDLGYFVLFSSATTFVGNPGQGAYVAANAYLEALARRRKAEGLPALALAWGAIANTGVLARNRGLMEALSSRIGVKPIAPDTALDLMKDALEEQGPSPDDAVIALAPMDWAAAKSRLAVLKSPTYCAVVPESAAAEGAANRVDLRAVIEKEGLDAAKAAATDAVVATVSRVLRLPAEDVSLFRPLSEVGVDSLMATELALSLEDRFGLEMPFSASASGLSVNGLVTQIIGFAGGPTTGANGSAEAPAPVAQALAGRHLENASEETITSLSRLIEQAGQQSGERH